MKKLKQIIIFLAIITVSLGWFLYILAAVPIIPVLNDAISYIETIENVNRVLEIDANTSYELSLEGFQLNLTDAFGENQRKYFDDLMDAVATRQENWLASFELAKIQKAREDVNKLTFETQRELTDQGIIIPVRDPVTNKEFTIKKEGRIITNPDDFLFEEPVQKARDFVYCYLAPWKHFAWGDDLRFCDELGLTGQLTGEIPGKLTDTSCTSQKVCQLLPQKKEGMQCPSDVTRDKIKQRLLNSLVRKEHKWVTAPPESWYSPLICERILNSFSCFDKENCFTNCDIISGTCSVEKLENIPTVTERAKIEDTHGTLTRPVAYVKDATIYEFQQAAGNPNNDSSSLERKLLQQTQDIISQYQTLRQTQYAAGQGIRPEKYLVGQEDRQAGNCGQRHYNPETKSFEQGDCKNLDKKYFGRALDKNYPTYGLMTDPSDPEKKIPRPKAYSNETWWFDTENVESPAIVLLQKMAAATQAQFDLARMGFKIYPDGVEGVQQTGNAVTDAQTSRVAKTLANAGSNLNNEKAASLAGQIAGDTKEENKAIINATTATAIGQVAADRILDPATRDQIHKKLESTLYNNVDMGTATNIRNNTIEPILKAYSGQTMSPALMNKMNSDINSQVNKQLDAYYHPIESGIKNVLRDFLGPLNNSKIGQIANQLTDKVLGNYNKNLGIGIHSIFGNNLNTNLSTLQGSQVDNTVTNVLTSGVNRLANGFLGKLPSPIASMLQPTVSDTLNKINSAAGGFVKSQLGKVLGGETLNKFSGLLNNALTEALGIGGMISNLACSVFNSPMTMLASGCPAAECNGFKITNGAGTQIGCLSYRESTITSKLPPVTELPAPWEDSNAYANLPQDYFLGYDKDGNSVPPTLGPGYYLNRWYKDINQMYLPQGEPNAFTRILKQWFCLEGDGNCFAQRDPKYYSP